MAYIKDGSNILRCVVLSTEEDNALHNAAKKAGMSEEEYIRKKVLEVENQSISEQTLKEHTEAIYAISEEIRYYTSNENPNRWLFAADLSLIAENQEKLYAIEKSLIEEIRNNGKYGPAEQLP